MPEEVKLRLVVHVTYCGVTMTMPFEWLEDFIEQLAEKSNRLKDELERNHTTPSPN